MNVPLPYEIAATLATVLGVPALFIVRARRRQGWRAALDALGDLVAGSR